MTDSLENKKILLAVCGGIAAYKAVLLVRELTSLGALVRVVMTQSATEFITPMTFQALSGEGVRCDLFDAQAERAMGHIELARWADYLLVAPATANCLAKFAHGIADDLLSTLYLVTQTPVIVCPAMNQQMWSHPATQANCALLRSHGVLIVPPEEGVQACGEFGFGRMSAVENILHALYLQALSPELLLGQHVVITAGPTREAIDPVRYISNHSSGKMGYALARAAVHAGARVTLISGPSALPVPPQVTFVAVDSAEDMLQAVMQHLSEHSIFIGAAAVADYRVHLVAEHKMKKQQHTSLSLELVQNPDILQAVVASGKAAFVVGFAAETQSVIEYAKAKMHQKKLNMIVANLVGKAQGFDTDHHEVTVLTADQSIVLPRVHKTVIAGQIIAIVAANLQNGSQLP